MYLAFGVFVSLINLVCSYFLIIIMCRFCIIYSAWSSPYFSFTAIIFTIFRAHGGPLTLNLYFPWLFSWRILASALSFLSSSLCCLVMSWLMFTSMSYFISSSDRPCLFPLVSFFVSSSFILLKCLNRFILQSRSSRHTRIGLFSFGSYLPSLWIFVMFSCFRSTWQILAILLPDTPNHHLNQSWFIIRKILWHSPEGKFTGNAQDIYPWYGFEIINSRLQLHYVGANGIPVCEIKVLPDGTYCVWTTNKHVMAN